jgi:acyl-CoA thioesterase-2
VTETPLEELIRLLDVEQLEDNLFRGFHPAGRKHRLFGGQIIAQSLISAARTVPDDRPVHSLHAYFLRPGDPSTPAIFDVERIRDGRSFTTRRIVVIQHGQAIFNMDASFQVGEEGLEHADTMPNLEPPLEADLVEETKGGAFISYLVDFEKLSEDQPQRAEKFIWFKANGEVPDDPMLHTALMAYESDSALLGTARLPHQGGFQRDKMQMASLDHALWFQRPVSVNDWQLYTLDSPAAARSRGYTRGTIFSADGQLIANVQQEGLMRLWN